MPTNVKQFNIAIQAKTVAVEKHLVVFHQKIVMDLLTRILLGNPVKTGRSRGAWQTGLTPNDENPADIRSAGEALLAGRAGIAGIQPFGIIYIWNNVRYIAFLEAGSSQQAPNGFVALSIEAMRGVIEKAEFRLL